MTGTPVAAPPSVADLIAAWHEAMQDVRAVVAGLGADGWGRPSVLPGWSVGDVVAHLTWIERILLGRPDPPHAPDWTRLPHVDSDFGRVTEVPVDLRRSRSRADVLAEFDTTIADRLAALRAGPADPQAPAVNPFGRASTLAAVLRMRTFDTWVHGQDIRLAVGQPGATETAPARIAAEQIAAALGFVWAKKVAAPAGTTLVVAVAPPGIELRRAVTRSPEGLGVDIDPPDAPTVGLGMQFDDFVQLGCGRTRPDRSLGQARARVVITGDHDLGTRAVANLGITP